MRHYTSSFFQDEPDEYPRLKILPRIKDDAWENTIRISSKYYPPITIHLLTESDLYKFCNSVISELRRYRKEQGYDR